jgi:hypothetical protein
MRTYPQAARTRTLPAARARRRWSGWLTETKRKRRLLQMERLETIERLQREERQARRKAEYTPTIRPW